MGKSGKIAIRTENRMRKSEKWLALCDPDCEQKDVFPNCDCDIALEYRYYKQIEEAEELV